MKIKEVLKDNGLKVTNGRVAIMNIIVNEKDGSISAEKILDKLRESQESINLSTVYRSLETFYEKGLIERIMSEEGIHLYKIVKHKHKHLLECDVCHKEVEMQCPISQIEEIVKNQTGFTLTAHSLKLKGVCEKCKKEK